MYETKDLNMGYDTPEAKALLKEWNEAADIVKQGKSKLRELETQMKNNICPFKVGQVFVRETDGKKFVINSINVDDFYLRYGDIDKGKSIHFYYTFRAITKSGKPSLNGTSYVKTKELTPTDEIIEL